MWIYANPNPCRAEEADCVVRAISIATGMSWKQTHTALCDLSHQKCTMPSVNWLWGLYLRKNGFEQFLLPDTCPACTTVKEFCRRYPRGTYVIGTGNHAICAIDGNYLDAWDSGEEVVTTFYARKRGKEHG